MRMNRYTVILPALLTVAAISCQRQPEPETAQDAIRFSATTESVMLEELDTRTVYSGQVVSGKERIEWVAGDRFHVYCPESRNVKSAAYTVVGETHTSGSVESQSTSLSPANANATLTWNSGSSYRFYGRYPDPTWSGAPSESAYKGQSSVSTSFTCVIPATQAPTRSGSSNTWLPDMKYAYMTAYATAARNAENITLPFTPVYNAFELTIPNDYPSGTFAVSKVELIASAQRLNGTYQVTIADTPVPTVPAASTEADRTVTANFSPAVNIAPGASNAMVLTFFTCPVTVAGTASDNLSVRITLENGDVRTLPLKTSTSNWLGCAARTKTRVTCTTVPSPYGTHYNTMLSAQNMNIDSYSSYGSVSLVSVKSVGMQSEPAPWTVEYSTNGTTWSTTSPSSGVFASPSSGNGSLTGETVNICRSSSSALETYYIRFKNDGNSTTLTVQVDALMRFSTSSTRTVVFSKGNLQYIGSAATPYWKFADNQWDYLGSTTGQKSTSANVDRDLFGWATSGYNGKNPWMTSTNATDYGPAISSGEWTSDSDQWDWGVYNTISNGGGYSWRTLTKTEWQYLFNNRSCSPRYAEATVAGVPGLILFPDGYIHPSGVAAISNTDENVSGYSDNTFDASAWTLLEQAGCVFLPAAGFREGATLFGVGGHGFYWSSTAGGSSIAYHLWFYGGNVSPGSNSYPYAAYSVRLVRD